MGELIGKDLGGVGHAGVSFSGGKLVVEADVDSSKIVDLVIDAAEKAIPGDFDKPLLEIVRAAAKTALASV